LKVCVLGRGKVGTALAREFGRAGLTTAQLRGRAPWRPLPPAQVYLLAIPEVALAPVAAALGPQLPKPAVVLHCAGSRSHEELAALRDYGAAIGVLHPLVSFADRKRPPPLAGATFVFQGDARAHRDARKLVRALGAHLLKAEAVGPAYHAAAALVANAGVALAWSGLHILSSLGFPEQQATQALAGLLASVAHNIRHVGLPGALTGPVVRGDARTVDGHLKALHALDASSAGLYAGMQELVVACALDAGLSTEAARQIREVVARDQRKSRPPRARTRRQRKT
jgi:predicted short-subunit dehydrogenase-like oxidoreductase (DUF2520 family)